MNDKISRIIIELVSDYADQTQNNLIKTPNPDTALYGLKSNIDSIGLVSIIVATEQKIEEEFGVAITLADEKAMSQNNSPFLSIGSLSDYIGNLLKGKNDVE